MKPNMKYNHLFIIAAVFLLILPFSCTREFDDLEPATFPSKGEVFIDGFTADLAYAAFGGSNVTAFQVDNAVAYNGSTASMRFDVPNGDDPGGNFAAGIFLSNFGRDLSDFDALTFWIKATETSIIDEIGFGFTFAEEKYRSSIKGLTATTGWKKVIIPMADPSKFIEERGLLYYVDTPEDGKGYTFWIDEVKFEKLGTIAHPKPAILETQDQVIPAETGAKLPIGGIFSTFNLPNGVDQRVELAPSFFTFSSSATSVAVVDELGVVSVIDSGLAVITAQLGDIDALGSLTVQASGEAVKPPDAAPTPEVSADSVISMFSNAYEDVTVDTWNPFWEFSTAEVADIKIGDDDVKQYKSLNFVGILTESEQIDATEMTHFHMDIWTPDPTALPAAFRILLRDYGPDGNFDGGDDSFHELTFTSPTLQTEQWFSIDVPLSAFTGLFNRANLAQMVLSGDLPNVFIDNVYYYQGEDTGGSGGPEVAAPTPTQNVADVISIFSDTYTNIPGTDFNPDWGQATVVTEVSIEGNNTLRYGGLNYQGIQLESSQDFSGMEFLHIDFWTENSTTLNAFMISDGPVETAYALNVPTSGWGSVDIPLSDFAPVDIADVIQFKFDGDGDIYLDNIYFHRGGGGATEPEMPAPDPVYSEADVISVFSDAYTNIAGTDFNPDWGQATVVSEVSIDGNNTLLYTGLNYQGIQLDGGQNVSEMDFLHIDFWTANSTALSTFLISSGPVETAYALTVSTSGWASVDIPLSDFDPVDLMDIIQFKFEGNGDIYLDNIFFRKDAGAPTEPEMPAPAPTQDAANVISVFSDAYMNLAGTDLNPNWGQATVVTEESIDGNNTLLYSGLNYQGIQLGSAQDVSGMDFLHIDFWTANSTALSTFLISGGPVETAYALTVPTSGWASVDIPLSDFDPVNLADVIQLKFEGNGDIYLDNIYFFSEGGAPSEPGMPAPDPIHDEADVISIFSDAYHQCCRYRFQP